MGYVPLMGYVSIAVEDCFSFVIKLTLLLKESHEDVLLNVRNVLNVND